MEALEERRDVPSERVARRELEGSGNDIAESAKSSEKPRAQVIRNFESPIGTRSCFLYVRYCIGNSERKHIL